MPRSHPRVLLAGRTREDRRRNRAGILLRSFTIAPSTRERYEVAVLQVLPYLEAEGIEHADHLLCEWMELEWARGTAVNSIADTLSGLHYFLPELKGNLRLAWRLFRSWRRVEVPTRAPPITLLIITALVARAVELCEISFATLISIGFHALLRTGELLALQYGDFEFNSQCGVVTLKSSKSGLRRGMEEAVAIRDGLSLSLLRTLFCLRQPSRGDKLWPHSGQSFRDKFRQLLRFFNIEHLEFKPYSLRRGGATYLLQEGVPLDTILIRGRWHSLAVARLYLEDGMAQIPNIRIAPADRARLESYSGQCPVTAYRP